MVEQGLGGAVRGEKDFCVLILTGPDLVCMRRARRFRGYFSAQTKTQIDVGLGIADLAKAEISEGTDPLDRPVAAEALGSSPVVPDSLWLLATNQAADPLRRPSSQRGGQSDSADCRCCRKRRTEASRSRPIAMSYAWRASPCAPVLASNSARAAQ